MPRIQAPEKRAAEPGGKSQPSPRAFVLRALAMKALALGATGTAAAWLVGIGLLGRPYYFAWAIVAAMGLYLLLAWLLYLRDDAIMSRPRQPEAGRSGPPPAPAALRGSVRVLLLAAAMLAVLSLVLYFCFGIGAAP